MPFVTAGYDGCCLNSEKHFVTSLKPSVDGAKAAEQKVLLFPCAE
jgi:hypothetical protein